MQLYKKWGWSKVPSRPAVIKKDFLLHGNLHDEGRMRLRAAEQSLTSTQQSSKQNSWHEVLLSFKW
jgi:hypothetical protein